MNIDLKQIAEGLDKVVKENEALLSINQGIHILGEVIKKTKKADWTTTPNPFSSGTTYANKSWGLELTHGYREMPTIRMNGRTYNLNYTEGAYLRDIIQAL